MEFLHLGSKDMKAFVSRVSPFVDSIPAVSVEL